MRLYSVECLLLWARVTFRIRFTVWLVSGYAHAFILLSVVVAKTPKLGVRVTGDSLETTAPYKFFTYLLTYIRKTGYKWRVESFIVNCIGDCHFDTSALFWRGPWQLQPKIAQIRVHNILPTRHHYKSNPNPNRNRNPTTKRHEIVNIQLNIVSRYVSR